MMRDLGNKEIMSRNLRRLMSDKQVSAKEMSKTLKFPYTTLLSWLKAENYPRIDKIEAMADYFGVMKSELIEEQIAVTATEKPVTYTYDGLSENQKQLIDFARTVPEDKAAMILKVIQSIVESD